VRLDCNRNFYKTIFWLPFYKIGQKGSLQTLKKQTPELICNEKHEMATKLVL
jgi:hypothetical protein